MSSNYPNDVVLRLGGDLIPPEAFTKAIDDLRTILREVDKSLGGMERLEWSIGDLRFGSAEIALVPRPKSERDPDPSSEVIRSFREGIREIEERRQKPTVFTGTALERVKSLSSLVNGAVTGVTLETRVKGHSSKPTTITDRTAKNVNAMIGVGAVSIGSVEGRLELLSIRDDVYFSLREPTRNLVHCSCDERMLRQIGHLLGRRIVVTGEITHNLRGLPDRVKVTREPRVLGEREDLPTIEEFKNAFNE